MSGREHRQHHRLTLSPSMAPSRFISRSEKFLIKKGIAQGDKSTHSPPWFETRGLLTICGFQFRLCHPPFPREKCRAPNARVPAPRFYMTLGKEVPKPQFSFSFLLFIYF